MIALVERGLGKSIRANEAVLDVGMLLIGSFEVQKQYVSQEDPTLAWQWPGTQEDCMKYLISGISCRNHTS